MAGDFASVISVLADAGVEFVVIGGLAAQAHGAARLTQDAHFIYRRTPENIRRLTLALAPHRPYPRGAPPGLPFAFDEATIQRGLNFTLTTGLGDVDFLGEMVGGGTFEQVLPKHHHVAGLRPLSPRARLACADSSQAGRGSPERFRGYCGARGAGRRARARLMSAEWPSCSLAR